MLLLALHVYSTYKGGDGAKWCELLRRDYNRTMVSNATICLLDRVQRAFSHDWSHEFGGQTLLFVRRYHQGPAETRLGSTVVSCLHDEGGVCPSLFWGSFLESFVNCCKVIWTLCVVMGHRCAIISNSRLFNSSEETSHASGWKLQNEYEVSKIVFDC